MNFINANKSKSLTNDSADVPLPIVTFTRWIYFGTAVTGFLLQLPILTTILFFLVLPSVVFGKRANVLGTLGRQLFASQLPNALREDRRIIHFNNFLVVVFLGLAQVFFLLNLSGVAWVFALLMVGATAMALSGFCIGCVFFFGLKVDRLGVFGKGW